MQIAENIAAYRKKCGLTQEQLANCLNVTVGAVSKWECAANRPDIELLPAIADIFQITVDELLGHTEGKTKLQQELHWGNELICRGKYEEAFALAHELLAQYPNHFKSNKLMADAGYSVCFSSDGGDKIIAEKTIFYYEKCLELYEDSCIAIISKEEIYLRIASLYALDGMQEYEKAISIAERYNYAGKYDNVIAAYFIQAGRTEEGKQKLLWHSIEQQIFVHNDLSALAEVFSKEEDFDAALKCEKAKYAQFSVFEQEIPSYADRALAGVALRISDLCRQLQREQEAWEWKKQAIFHAAKYEKNPTMGISGMKHCENIPGRMIDDLEERILELAAEARK